jgi:hypothetical protein
VRWGGGREGSRGRGGGRAVDDVHNKLSTGIEHEEGEAHQGQGKHDVELRHPDGFLCFL